MHLRWSCTENIFQCKTIVRDTYDGLAWNRKSQHALTMSIFVYYYLFSKIYYKLCYIQVKCIILLNATVVFSITNALITL